MSELVERLRHMPSSFNDALRIIDDAADRIETLQEQVRQLEAALRLTRPYIETHTLSPNGTMATVLAKIDAALAPEQDK